MKRAPKRPVVIAVEIPIREERRIRTALRAFQILTEHHDIRLRLAVRRDDITAFNPWHAIQELGLTNTVTYLPFFDNADLPDVIGDADVWLEAPQAVPSASVILAMQRGVVVAGKADLALPSECFWSIGDFEQADELATRLALLLAGKKAMGTLQASARKFVKARIPFSCEPATYVSPHQERSVHGWYTNEHFVLFVTSSRPDQPHGPGALTKRWLEQIRSLGCRIICVHYALPGTSAEPFRDHVDHYFSVPATSALSGQGEAPFDTHLDDWCGSELTLKVQEICNTYSIGVCFVQSAHLSRVLDRIPARIRRVLAIDSVFEAGRFVTRGSGDDNLERVVSLTRDGERIACARADVILTTSDDQYNRHHALAPSKEVLSLDESAPHASLMERALWAPFTVPNKAHRHFLRYHDVTMKYLSRFVTDFDGLVMLEIGPDDHLSLARSVLANGARQVIGLQTTEQTYDDLPARLQFRMVSSTRWKGVKNNSVDVVYGVGVLEHITHFDEVVGEIARVLKPGGRVFLQGCPMWGSSHGHHVVVFDSVGQLKYDFTRAERNPLQPWQHLALTKDQIREKLIEQLPESDADSILAMVFGEGIGSNKTLPGEIIAAFRKRLHTDAVRYLDAGEKNRHYQAALRRYSEKELLTDALMIYARKPTRQPARSGERPLVSVIVPLSRLTPMVRAALESVATQTYTNLEILLIADGAPAACLATAEEYAGIDCRFQLLPPSSRNARKGVSGIAAKAAGTHVFLYDGDITLDCRAIETFVLSQYLRPVRKRPVGRLRQPIRAAKPRLAAVSSRRGRRIEIAS